jgi:hypothetical protein
MNPYEAPGEGALLPGPLRARSFNLLWARADVLVKKYKVGVSLNLLSGLEIFSVDGDVVHRKQSFKPFGARPIPLPDGTKAEVRMHLWPLFRVSVWADGVCLVRDLFPQLAAFELATLGFAALGAAAALLLS